MDDLPLPLDWSPRPLCFCCSIPPAGISRLADAVIVFEATISLAFRRASPPLTLAAHAAILFSDDWPASRSSRRQATESSACGCGRRLLPRASAALHLRLPPKAAYRRHPADSHPRARRCPGSLRFSFLARKAFLRVPALPPRRPPPPRPPHLAPHPPQTLTPPTP